MAVLGLCATMAAAQAPPPSPPARVKETAAKGRMTRERLARFEGPHIAFSRIVHIEQVDLDRDGIFEALVDGIGTVKSLPRRWRSRGRATQCASSGTGRSNARRVSVTKIPAEPVQRAAAGPKRSATEPAKRLPIGRRPSHASA